MKKNLLSLVIVAIALVANAQSTLFYESFDQCLSTGGNDGSWSGSVANGTFKPDNEWTVSNAYAGDKCAKFGASTKAGSATTPVLNLNGNATLTFKAGAWSSSSESTTLNVTISGGGTLSATTVTLVKGSFSEYSIDIVGGTSSSTITFASSVSSKGRFFLDEVKISSPNAIVVEKPTFSVEGGVYTEPLDLTLSAETGNSIYYTLDGTNPSVDSELYQGEAIKISEYTVVKAIAVDSQGATSSIATATYAFQNTQNTAMTVAEALAWIEAGKDATTEQYIAGYITEITEVSTSYGNATYNIADAIGSTDELVVFRGKYINGEKFTTEDQIEVGDKVLIYGKLKDYNGTPEVDTNNHIVSIIEDVSVGIEEIATENAPVEYYNLQGVKVANPIDGIFIKKQGGKTTKIVL